MHSATESPGTRSPIAPVRLRAEAESSAAAPEWLACVLIRIPDLNALDASPAEPWTRQLQRIEAELAEPAETPLVEYVPLDRAPEPIKAGSRRERLQQMIYPRMRQAPSVALLFGAVALAIVLLIAALRGDRPRGEPSLETASGEEVGASGDEVENSLLEWANTDGHAGDAKSSSSLDTAGAIEHPSDPPPHLAKQSATTGQYIAQRPEPSLAAPGETNGDAAAHDSHRSMLNLDQHTPPHAAPAETERVVPLPRVDETDGPLLQPADMAPPANYNAPQANYDAPPAEYTAPPAEYNAPPEYAGPQTLYEARRPDDRVPPVEFQGVIARPDVASPDARGMHDRY